MLCFRPPNRKKNPFCPIDNKPLTESDLFPDNYTRREIQLIRKSCPNAEQGCPEAVSPLDLDAHVLHCTYRRQHDCTFKGCGCTFQTNELTDVATHLQNEMSTHLNVRCDPCPQGCCYTSQSHQFCFLFCSYS